MLKLLMVVCLAVLMTVTITVSSIAAEKPAAKENWNFKLQTAYGRKVVHTIFDVEFMRRITEQTKGQITFTYYPQASLMGRREAWKGVQEGILDIADTGYGYDRANMELAGELMWHPGNWGYDKFMKHARDPGSYYDWVEPYCKRLGMKTLSLSMTYPALLFSSKPLNKLEDLKGLRFRDSGGMADWIKAFGMIPMPIKGEDFYEAVQRGVIDAGQQSMDAFVDQKWYEVCPHIMENKVMNPAAMSLMMNLKSFNSLPKDLQRLMIDTAEETHHWVYKDQKILFEEYKQKILSHRGTTWWTASPEVNKELLRRLDVVWEKYKAKYGEEKWNAWLKVQEKIR
jgi:TRAP-type C4-dicarboxylate transport system substrate-binding protein